MEQPYIHLHKTESQLLRWYNGKFRENKIGFSSYKEFISWYESTEKTCHYCGLTEIQSQQIVRQNKLCSKRFPQNGLHGRGTSRGMWMEIDRYDPRGKYEIGNVVMCCYFCNNDKSDVFHGDAYKCFQENRLAFLVSLLKEW